MFKRVLVLLAALVMLAACLPAGAEEALPVYRIVERTEQGDITLGSGVLFRRADTLLTAASVAKGDSLYACGSDGEFAVRCIGQVAGSGLALVTLAGSSSAVPLDVTASTDAALTLTGVNRAGETLTLPVTHARTDADERYGSVLLSSEEGLLPGAVMPGADGGIAAIVTSQRGEGRGVYEALTGADMAKALGGAGTAAAEAPADDADADAGFVYEVFSAYADGAITLDWTDSAGYPEGDDVYFSVYFVLGLNPYYNYVPVQPGQTRQQIPVPPGQTVICWVGYSRGEHRHDMMPGNDQPYITVNTGNVALLTDNGFRNVSCSVTMAAPGHEDAASLPIVPVTREALADESLALYYQTEDTYLVTETSDDHMLLLTLYTPGGQVFCSEGRYTYMPELCAGDAWVMDLSALVTSCRTYGLQDDLPAGEYKVVCYIDGKLAGGAVFTLP